MEDSIPTSFRNPLLNFHQFWFATNIFHRSYVEQWFFSLVLLLGPTLCSHRAISWVTHPRDLLWDFEKEWEERKFIPDDGFSWNPILGFDIFIVSHGRVVSLSNVK